jgi:hypothetical protein
MPKRQRIASPLDDLIPSRRTRAAPARRAADRIRSTPAKAPPASTKPTADSSDWEENNVRVTFYCPRPMLEKVEKEIVRSGRSKTRVIVDAIEHHLSSGWPASKARASRA